ncbi:MarR family winged helix-turn-helix transcriptional regulator [Nocardia spumae]|uniref:MarR family winged helix-turn-helix transcriptional regulator n=1 Tax=Nocardia spumae TaxID=2887190 RepID=UPI001D15629D|nr:MarR family transcriptional regulator [Nocardia spumae]
MGQDGGVGDVDLSVGYVLKQAATALRVRMDAVLRPLELTVPQYACLELLGQREGLSSAELARGVFVSRQAMNQVLRGLQERGLLARPAVTEHGRALPSRLTPDGERVLRTASRAVADVERQMLSAFDPARRQGLRDDLAACVEALSPRSP